MVPNKISPSMYHREGLKKITKKYGFIHIWVGGWVRLGTISIKKQKNMHLKSIREGFNKKTKKIWIYPYLGGWVVQDGYNIHKKQK